MKALIYLGLVILVYGFFSCKKLETAGPYYNDSTQIYQSVNYKVTATQASPWDSAHNWLGCNLSTTFTRSVGAPDYLVNAPGVNMEIDNSGNGVSFTYTAGGGATFMIGLGDLPGITTDFSINTPYAYTHDYNSDLGPIYLGLGNESAEVAYFKDVTLVPSDATFSASVITQSLHVVFSNKYSITRGNVVYHLADGQLTGYMIRRYGITDPAKYVQRWDFELDFKGVGYNNN
jgi:hypothetical protein